VIERPSAQRPDQAWADLDLAGMAAWLPARASGAYTLPLVRRAHGAAYRGSAFAIDPITHSHRRISSRPVAARADDGERRPSTGCVRRAPSTTAACAP
jgi:hypothetical protein